MISLSLWVMMMEVSTSFLNSISRSSSILASSSLREEVGSSKMSSFTFLEKALAISTSCCLPVPISLTRVWADSFSPTWRMWRSASLKVLSQSMYPMEFLISLPRNIFSTMDSRGIRASSWWMMTMPWASLSFWVLNWHSLPS